MPLTKVLVLLISIWGKLQNKIQESFVKTGNFMSNVNVQDLWISEIKTELICIVDFTET